MLHCGSSAYTGARYVIGGNHDPIPPPLRARSKYRIWIWHNRILEIPLAHAYVLRFIHDRRRKEKEKSKTEW